ncbi:hypothetical protein [Desulfocurvibacter africanus]|uniref:hypothetical protein n=1 Tax=Desulfocurvibacter africanus TaxID=873 RepID=UPI0002FC20D6|nr:hypothetical protein [Desulfocurvibacter africanus]
MRAHRRHREARIELTIFYTERKPVGPIWSTGTLGVVLFYAFFSAIYFIGLRR